MRAGPASAGDEAHGLAFAPLEDLAVEVRRVAELRLGVELGAVESDAALGELASCVALGRNQP